ncbi:MAG: hypothetical protein NVS3B7_20300 [Candidatus Elarobacter sp.]
MDSRARRFSGILAAAALLVLSYAPMVRAQERMPVLWFQGTRLIFEHAVAMQGDLGVSTGDPGLHHFLEKLGATVAYSPQQRYIVITAQDRRTVVFTVGDAAYTIAGVRGRAPFAVLADGNDAVLPFYTLARALYVEPVADATETVLQPRVGSLDVRTDGPRPVVTLRAAMPLVTGAASDTPDRLQIAFVGHGSALAAARRVPGTAVDAIDVVTGGSTRVPTTTLTISAARGTTHRIVPGPSPDVFTVVFEPRAPGESRTVGGGGGAPPPPPPPPPRAPPGPTPCPETGPVFASALV